MSEIKDTIYSILAELEDVLMYDRDFCLALTNVFEQFVLDDLKLDPTDNIRDRIEAERRILRKLDLLRSIREVNDND